MARPPAPSHLHAPDRGTEGHQSVFLLPSSSCGVSGVPVEHLEEYGRVNESPSSLEINTRMHKGSTMNTVV